MNGYIPDTNVSYVELANLGKNGAEHTTLLRSKLSTSAHKLKMGECSLQFLNRFASSSHMQGLL